MKPEIPKFFARRTPLTLAIFKDIQKLTLEFPRLLNKSSFTPKERDYLRLQYRTFRYFREKILRVRSKDRLKDPSFLLLLILFLFYFEILNNWIKKASKKGLSTRGKGWLAWLRNIHIESIEDLKSFLLLEADINTDREGAASSATFYFRKQEEEIDGAESGIPETPTLRAPQLSYGELLKNLPVVLDRVRKTGQRIIGTFESLLPYCSAEEYPKVWGLRAGIDQILAFNDTIIKTVLQDKTLPSYEDIVKLGQIDKGLEILEKIIKVSEQDKKPTDLPSPTGSTVY